MSYYIHLISITAVLTREEIIKNNVTWLEYTHALILQSCNLFLTHLRLVEKSPISDLAGILYSYFYPVVKRSCEEMIWNAAD